MAKKKNVNFFFIPDNYYDLGNVETILIAKKGSSSSRLVICLLTCVREIIVQRNNTRICRSRQSVRWPYDCPINRKRALQQYYNYH